MNFLEFFKLDKIPFKLSGEPSFRYRFYDQMMVIHSVVNFIKKNSGTYFVLGKEGVGKTFVANEIYDNINFSQKTFFFKGSGLKSIKESFKSFFNIPAEIISDKGVINYFIDNMENHESTIIVDDYQDLTGKEYDFVDYLSKVFANKENGINSSFIIFSKTPPSDILKKNISKKARIKRISSFISLRYIKTMIKNTLSLDGNSNIFSLADRLLIVFFSAGRIKFLNIICSDLMHKAYNKGIYRISYKDFLHFIKSESYIFKVAIGHRFKQLFWVITFVFLVLMGKDIIEDKIKTQTDFELKLEIEQELKDMQKELQKVLNIQEES